MDASVHTPHCRPVRARSVMATTICRIDATTDPGGARTERAVRNRLHRTARHADAIPAQAGRPNHHRYQGGGAARGGWQAAAGAIWLASALAREGQSLQPGQFINSAKIRTNRPSWATLQPRATSNGHACPPSTGHSAFDSSAARHLIRRHESTKHLRHCRQLVAP